MTDSSQLIPQPDIQSLVYSIATRGLWDLVSPTSSEIPAESGIFLLGFEEGENHRVIPIPYLTP